MEETSWYITSTSLDAKALQEGIRNHWSIENSLHYVKDGTFKEDASLIRTGHAPTNLSLIRNIGIWALKKAGYESYPQAIRKMGGKVRELLGLLE